MSERPRRIVYTIWPRTARWDQPDARRVREAHGGWDMQRPVSVPATRDQGTSSDGRFSNGEQSERSEQLMSEKAGQQLGRWEENTRAQGHAP